MTTWNWDGPIFWDQRGYSSTEELVALKQQLKDEVSTIQMQIEADALGASMFVAPDWRGRAKRAMAKRRHVLAEINKRLRLAAAAPKPKGPETPRRGSLVGCEAVAEIERRGPSEYLLRISAMDGMGGFATRVEADHLALVASAIRAALKPDFAGAVRVQYRNDGPDHVEFEDPVHRRPVWVRVYSGGLPGLGK